ncbi:hypothetical protein PND25_13150, partial [Lacticaseibacillus rhamnosus]|uniref:hypothetical protein n=1 Tax=Lacticaseibacillus rhamnosus TaxID=47715 RepID=UPI0023305BB8
MSEDKSRQRLGSAALMLMTFSAVFAFPSIVNNSIQLKVESTKISPEPWCSRFPYLITSNI